MKPETGLQPALGSAGVSMRPAPILSPERPEAGAAGRHAIQLPCTDAQCLGQDEAYFYIEEEGGRRRIRFHEYGEIFSRRGLYEQLFYDRLKCTSPARMATWLNRACQEEGEPMQAMRVLDLGAGNGMMGEALLEHGVARIVGVDILPEAKAATERDRPGVYDAYYVADLTKPSERLREDLKLWNFDCLTTVAALGFADIPPRAFIEAYNLVQPGGWICFNIKDSFLQPRDQSGFSRLIRRIVIVAESLSLHRMVRYRHRYSIDGRPLLYYGIVGRKVADITLDGDDIG